MTTLNIDDTARELVRWRDGLSWSQDFGRIAGAALAELARGEPAEPARIAARAGVAPDRLLDLLHGSPAEWDSDARLVGLGLTLRPTAHRFEIGGQTLYTWCAPDALAFPVLLNAPARIASPCRATGTPIHIDLGPDRVRRVEPASAVVSLVTPSVGLADLRERVCNQQHFFASEEAAADWRAQRPDALVVSVPDGFELTRRLIAGWFEIGDA